MFLIDELKEVIRRVYYIRHFGNDVGKNVSINPFKSIIQSASGSLLNDNIFVGNHFYLVGKVNIGKNVMIGPFVRILNGNHLFAVLGKSNFYLKPNQNIEKPITTIEDEVWIGANTTILNGSTIFMGAVVGAGSVVVRDIPPFVIAAGNPCTARRRIFSDERLKTHLQILGYQESLITDVIKLRQNLVGGLGIIDYSEKYEGCYNYELIVGIG